MTKQEIEFLYQKYKTPANVVAHSKVVERIAVFLAQQLKKRGIPVRIKLVSQAALLHDLLRTRKNHCQVTARVLRKKYPLLAEVIRQHRLGVILEGSFKNWEEKIVHYADKRVDHDQIVSLEQRLKRGKKRWKIKPRQDRTSLFLKKLKILEKEIFSKIKLKPNVINKLQNEISKKHWRHCH